MEFLFKNGSISVSSDKKNIIFENNTVVLDEFFIDCPGEYEKSGFLLYVRDFDGCFCVHFRAEGEWLGYMSCIPSSSEQKILDFFGQLDILIAPFSREQKSLLDQIEPRMLVAYGEKSGDLATMFGSEIAPSDSYKLKSQDINTDKTTIVPLQ